MAFRFKDLSILIVDDDASIREMMAAILKKLEFADIDTAGNGEAGFSLFKEKNHHIVITDWQMDPVNGIELVEKIRSKDSGSPNREVPVILATGYTNTKMIEQARNVGTTELLIKPYSADDLARRIAYVLNKPREFIDITTYAGPDRRRITKKGFNGPFQRKEDNV